jgi:hypothetical protein
MSNVDNEAGDYNIVILKEIQLYIALQKERKRKKEFYVVLTAPIFR